MNRTDLATEITDWLLPIQNAARLWGAEIRIACSADELAAVFPAGRRVAHVCAAADESGLPYTLEGYEVAVAGGRRGIKVRSQLVQRPSTPDEIAALAQATARPAPPRACTVEADA